MSSKSTGTRARTAIAGFVTAAVALGCSGGGNNGSNDASHGDLEAVITFPPSGSATGGAESLVVSGLIRELDGSRLSTGAVDALSVNGAPAEIDYEAGRWRASVPLLQEDGLKITAELMAGNAATIEAEILLNNLPVRPAYRFIEASPDGSGALVSDGDDLREVDLASGEETLLAAGVEDAFGLRLGIRSASDRGASYSVRRSAQAVYDAVRLDRHSGTWISAGGLPGGPFLWNEYLNFGLDEASPRLLLAFQSTSDDQLNDACELRQLALHSGLASTFIKTDSLLVSAGQPLKPFCAGALLVDPLSNQVLVSAKYGIDPDLRQLVRTDQPGLYGFDLDTGLARIVSDANTGTGPLLDTPEWLFTGDQAGKVLAVDDEHVMAVDVATGDREMVLESPEWPPLISDMDYDPVHQRLLIARDSNQVLSMRLTDGALEPLLSRYPAVGSGPALDSSTPSVIAASSGTFYNIDAFNNRLLSMPLSVTQREVVVAPLIAGQQSLPFSVTAMTHDEILGLLYFSTDARLYEIDPGTAAVTRLIPNEGEPGNYPLDISGLSLDPENRILYVCARTPDNPRKGIVSVDLRVGDTAIVSAGIPGAENDLLANVFDGENGRLLAVTATGDIVSIDLITGERSEVARNTGLPGSQLPGEPRTIAFDAVPGSLLVGYAPGVVAVDIASGSRQLISGKLRNISVDRTAGVIYGAYSVSDIVAMDRYSGEVATVSRASD